MWRQLEGGLAWHHIRRVVSAGLVTSCGRIGVQFEAAPMMTLAASFCPICLQASAAPH